MSFGKRPACLKKCSVPLDQHWLPSAGDVAGPDWDGLTVQIQAGFPRRHMEKFVNDF